MPSDSRIRPSPIDAGDKRFEESNAHTNVCFKALTWTWMIGVGFVVTSLTTLFALLC